MGVVHCTYESLRNETDALLRVHHSTSSRAGSWHHLSVATVANVTYPFWKLPQSHTARVRSPFRLRNLSLHGCRNHSICAELRCHRPRGCKQQRVFPRSLSSCHQRQGFPLTQPITAIISKRQSLAPMLLSACISKVTAFRCYAYTRRTVHTSTIYLRIFSKFQARSLCKEKCCFSR